MTNKNKKKNSNCNWALHKSRSHNYLLFLLGRAIVVGVSINRSLYHTITFPVCKFTTKN